jgi:hypothetical protein
MKAIDFFDIDLTDFSPAPMKAIDFFNIQYASTGIRIPTLWVFSQREPDCD